MTTRSPKSNVQCPLISHFDLLRELLLQLMLADIGPWTLDLGHGVGQGFSTSVQAGVNFKLPMGKKIASWAKPDIKDLVAAMQDPGDDVPGDSVRSLCPCHAGWEVFEKNVRAVFRHLKDPNRLVRADALHVFEDAVRMQMAAELKYYVEPGETRIGEKRASARYRSILERLEARRDNRIRRQKRNRRSH